MICELTRVVADKWGFLAASYCDHTLTERDFNWQVRDLEDVCAAYPQFAQLGMGRGAKPMEALRQRLSKVKSGQ